MKKAMMIIFGILILMMLSIAFGQATTAHAQDAVYVSGAASAPQCAPAFPSTGLAAGITASAEPVESIALTDVPLVPKLFLGLVCGLAVLMAVFPLFSDDLETAM